jgi:hypothetical protein
MGKIMDAIFARMRKYSGGTSRKEVSDCDLSGYSLVISPDRPVLSLTVGVRAVGGQLEEGGDGDDGKDVKFSVAPEDVPLPKGYRILLALLHGNTQWGGRNYRAAVSLAGLLAGRGLYPPQCPPGKRWEVECGKPVLPTCRKCYLAWALHEDLDEDPVEAPDGSLR